MPQDSRRKTVRLNLVKCSKDMRRIDAIKEVYLDTEIHMKVFFSASAIALPIFKSYVVFIV